MNLDRRQFVHLSAAGVLAHTAPELARLRQPRFKAIACDAFPIFDPRPIAALVESMFPGRGPAIMNAWRTRQFEYQWLRALGNQYADFLAATRDALIFAASELKLDMSPAARDRLMSAWTDLRVWPDAEQALGTLHREGVRLAFLSNMTEAMLTHGLRSAKLDHLFEAVISTDRIRSYKPDPRAYQLGVELLGLPKEEILFVAFAGWDVAGAKWFGYPTYWLNRQQQANEELGAVADASGPSLDALVRHVLT